MTIMKPWKIYIVFVVLFLSKPVYAQDWRELAVPVQGKKWVQPVQGQPAQPIWGHLHGMRIGLAPLPGPRGLIRIYTPYLKHTNNRIMNFLAMEPVVAGGKTRGFSELEMSHLDDKRGKRFWSANDSLQTNPQSELYPAGGIVGTVAGVETLTIFIFCETFENGAKVYLRLRFFEDRPYEVEIKTYAQPGSKPLDYFTVTATMGNFARLRTLYLHGKTKSSHELWPHYQGNAFTDHARFSLDKFVTGVDGNRFFIAAPDEADPSTASYAPGTAHHWRYQGKKGVQYWMVCKDENDFEGLVNGRYTYWASKSPIPGGISFENFELKAPFRQGRTMVFGISPYSPDVFIERKKSKNSSSKLK